MSASTIARAESHESMSQPNGAAATTTTGEPSRRWTWIAQSAASGLMLGLALNQRFGYAAGDFDHLVLSPLGMHWANPQWFANDWTIAHAPQPHWLFDVVTWFGVKAGSLASVYFVYFAAAMFVFGAATTLLARKWVPQYSWQAVLAVTALAATTPLYLLGSGAILWPVALPGVLGGFLLYLLVAALLTGHNRLAAWVSIAVALAHVQAGAIAVVLLAVLAIAALVRSRRVDLSLAIGAVTTLAVVIFELRLRPVAGNIADFAAICDTLIPYHCNATVWRRAVILSGLAVIALSLLTYFYFKRDERARWMLVLVLPAAGLVGGLIADFLNVPVLGVLAQGTNVYRLAVIFVPILAWGMLAPLFADLNPRRRWLLLAVVVGLWYLSLRGELWGLAEPDAKNEHWLFGLLLALVAGCVAMTVPGIVSRPDRMQRLAVLVLVLACFSSAFQGFRSASIRPFEPGLMQHRPELAAWGEAVQRAVPFGGQLLLPPQFVEARMVTKRAVVADCKYGPYGGQAWDEYEARLADLGGIQQCRRPDPDYARLTADQLEAAAKKYGAAYVGLLPQQSWEAYEFRKRGWTLIVPAPAPLDEPRFGERVGVNLWQAPWA